MVELRTVEELKSKLVEQAPGDDGAVYSAVLFHADWHPPATQMKAMVTHLQKDFAKTKFFLCDADKAAVVLTHCNVSALPSVLLFADGNEVGRVTGADPQALLKMLGELQAGKRDGAAAAAPTGGASAEEQLQRRLVALTNGAPVMLFMKGTRREPFCKFSKAAIALLDKHRAEYGTFDIFQDPAVREGLKKISDWPTYPQLYVKGEFIGGIDILNEMEENGELQEVLGAGKPNKSELKERLAALVKQHDVMLFMKGSPAEPQCRFSRKIVEVLREQQVDFGHFDILSDEAVRQGLKEFSKWPTYPQIYAHGALVGGLDVVQEILDSGGPEALKAELSGNPDEVQA